MKRVLERVIGLLKDTSVQVSETAKEVALSLKDLCPDFPSVYSKLTFMYQQLFSEHCEQIRGSNILRGSFQKITEGKSILEGLEQKPHSFQSSSLAAVSSSLLLSHLESNKNNLVFGFIPVSLMQQLEDSENWRMRVSAVQELENIVMTLETFQEIMPYLAVLLRFLTKLLEDNNFKVSICALNIVKEVLSQPGLAQQSNISQILPVCLKKLGDNKIAVRQSTFKVFLALAKHCKGKTVNNVVIPVLCDGLGSENWHIREEVVIVLIAFLLDSVEFEFLEIVPVLAKLLDDQKTKIRYVTTELLAVIARKNMNELMEALKPIVDENAMSALVFRFQNKALPILTEDYVEFPKAFPASAPAISSPYITTNSFSSPFNKTVEVADIRKDSEAFTPSTVNSSMSPFSNNKFKRIRPASETNSEQVSLRPPRKVFTLKEKPKVNYQAQFLMKQSQDKVPSIQITKPKDEKVYQSSPTIPKAKPESQSEENPIYLAVEDLKRLPNPEDSLQRCILAGSLDNWSDQFEALNTLRRLLKHHPEVFISQVTLHNICSDLIKWADSLRSSLSKNALIVISEMCENLGRTIDSEITDLLKILIKKAIDTNVFISEQADVAIESMCCFSNETKLVVSLINIANSSKNPQSKAKIAFCFSKVFKRLRYNVTRLRDSEKIMTILNEYLSDASFDVRNNSKEALISYSEGFSSEVEFEKGISRYVSDNARKKIMEAIRNKSFRTSSPLKRSAQREFRSSVVLDKNSRASRTRSIGFTQEPAELDQLQKFQTEMLSTEWKQRYETISELQDLVIRHARHLKTSNKLLTAIDLFCKGMSDSNLKVHIHSLNALGKIVPELNKAIEPHLNIIFAALGPGLGSANSAIREIAKSLALAIHEHCEAAAVMMAAVAAVPAANVRGKITLVFIVCETAEKVYEKKPQLVVKNVVPVAVKMADDNKADVKECAARMIRKLYHIMADAFFDAVPAGKTQKVLEILNESL
jgi:HEAT repeat protein